MATRRWLSHYTTRSVGRSMQELTLTTFTKADDYCEIMYTTDAGCFHLTPSCFMTLSFSLVLAAWLP
eukprot:g56423.t1